MAALSHKWGHLSQLLPPQKPHHHASACFAHFATRNHEQVFVTTLISPQRRVSRHGIPSPDSHAGACPTSAARADDRRRHRSSSLASGPESAFVMPGTTFQSASKPAARRHPQASAPKSRATQASRTWKKGPETIRALVDGGGGGNRTRVRRRLTPGPTCLAHRSVSSSGSTACETHRSTSLLDLTPARQAADRRRSRDSDPTSTSTSTSGFGAYALSGESVVVVVGN